MKKVKKFSGIGGSFGHTLKKKFYISRDWQEIQNERTGQYGKRFSGNYMSFYQKAIHMRDSNYLVVNKKEMLDILKQLAVCNVRSYG